MERDNSQNILVSIIIVNYNSFDLLDKCLKSLIRFTKLKDYEIIVVDNNSTQGKIEDILNQYKGINLIKNSTNRGFAAANNQAIRIAKSEYILLLNNDTEFIEDTISKILDFYKKRNERLLIGCKLLNEDGSLQPSVYQFPTILNIFSSNFFLYRVFPKSKRFNKYYLKELVIKEPIEVDVVIGAVIFCKKSDLMKLNGFDERFYFYAEETDLCKRFKDLGGKVIYYPNTAIYHKGGGATGNNSWFKYKHQAIAYIKYYQKHFTGINLALILFFHFSGVLLRIPILFISGIFLLDKHLIIRAFYYLKQIFIYPKNEFKTQKDK